ncbi:MULTISPECIES: DUF6473 family protein [unclassified Epibacterium]|uniref:DUF6473 family protein n=1 Tax=unclassified Epibacterium TaxID=2639179 RepID=UPI001EF4B507|nr:MULTISPECIES: DUF6473 family protein [unclassified Epibacterium]MCG7624140.1 DUF6473 family protein [Epibacterium sp. Ofav1-8]MCG7630425.1 DUF6473 family protein [Epibacterium sp. MM17-32]
MSYELKSADALVSELCSYGESRLRVRGPERDLRDPYISFLGGTEVFGRFIERPFPQGVEGQVGLACVNLGCVNAGVDAFLHDDSLMEIAAGGQLTILQVMGAQNLSNSFYKVHPRRNDRFLRPYDALVHLFPEVDFTDYHFNKHMLTSLRAISEDRFARVCADLQETWLTRMGRLIGMLNGDVVLLWLRYDMGAAETLGPSPTLVEPSMLDVLRPSVADVIELDVATAEQAQDIPGMIFGAMDLPAARLMLGPKEHDRIADAVASRLLRVLAAA